MNRAQKLVRRSREAAEVRSYQTDPDVVALRMETSRAWVERLGWTGLVLGLLFTMVNVQVFAAQGAPAWGAVWVTAWLLDPMVSLVLLAILGGESMTSRWKLPTDGWVRATKWAALTATYAMNTWHSWMLLDVAGILLHSVPPALVFFAAEALPQLRYRMTEAIERARAAASNGTSNGSDGPSAGSVEDTTPPAERALERPASTGWVDAGNRPVLPLTTPTEPHSRSHHDLGEEPLSLEPAPARVDTGTTVPDAARPNGEPAAAELSDTQLADRWRSLIEGGQLPADVSINAAAKTLGTSWKRANRVSALLSEPTEEPTEPASEPASAAV